MKHIIIIGGGLAGIVSSIQLSKGNFPCTVIEKNIYPFHKVCGEYVSNEVVPYLKEHHLYPGSCYTLPFINRFQLSSTNGKHAFLPLDLGGFGISRFAFDNFLYSKAKELGVKFLLNTTVDSVFFDNEKFFIETSQGKLVGDVVIGAYGKRAKLDKDLNRSFIYKRSPYVAVKYHARTNHPDELISLHNFKGGYCGVSNVENNITNICYLAHRDLLQACGSIPAFEQKILFQNPLLKNVFTNADFLFEKPLTINEISFETKSAVENHILMAGDTAGMIAPLCGNGMSIAIHSAKVVSDTILKFYNGSSTSRKSVESAYASSMQKFFARRLWMGRNMQRLFGSHFASNMAIHLALYLKPLARTLIKYSHGKPFIQDNNSIGLP